MVEASHIKVLHIASGDLWAGAEVQLFTLATALQNKQGISVAVVLLNYGKLQQKLGDAGIEVTVFDESNLNGFQIFRRLANKVREIEPDVIHTHRSKENILGSIAARLCGNIPSLRTAHGASEHRLPWYHIPKRLIVFMDWFCGRYLQHKIIAVSADLAGILQNDFPAQKIEIIENGIDIESLERIKKHNDYSGSHFRVGIGGRLVPIKRIDLFIRTAALFANEHPEINISFHIYGDGPLRMKLEILSQELNANSIVKFEGHSNNMHQSLADLSILLITSDHEGLPMILLEAMALKTPVIANAVGGIPAVLNQGEYGVLVPDHQPSAYANAIFELINNVEFRTSLVHTALNRVTAFYSSKKNANAYHTIYNNLVELQKVHLQIKKPNK